MQRSTKQLLGVVGLASVIAMTAIACSLPAPDASAADITISTEVRNRIPKLTILSPSDQETLTSRIISYRSERDMISREEVSLKCEKNGVETTSLVIDQTYATPTGEYATSIDTGLYCDASSSTYVLSTVGYSDTNVAVAHDSVEFMYRPIKVELEGSTAENGDPIIQITTERRIASLKIGVYTLRTRMGEPVFMDQNGNEVFVNISKQQLEAANYRIDVTLPMAEYNAPAGDYVARVIGYDADGNEVSVGTVEFPYDPQKPVEPGESGKPTGPDTPNTGSIFSGLNIARADFIISGGIVFGFVAAFAAFLILRKNRRQ